MANCEKGSVFIETALILPILISMYLFAADMFFYSKSKTNVTQVTRDAAIFLATARGSLSSSQSNLHQNSELQQLCIGDPGISDCAAAIAHNRVYLMLEGINPYLKLGQLSISSSFDGTRVHLTVSAPIETNFFFSGQIITRTATLRRIGS